MAASKRSSSASRSRSSTASKPKKASTRKKQKKVSWQGLEIVLPDELPDTLLFDIVEAEAGGGIMAILRCLRSMVGAEQFMKIRYKLEELGEKADASGLLDAVFAEYGWRLGES